MNGPSMQPRWLSGQLEAGEGDRGNGRRQGEGEEQGGGGQHGEDCGEVFFVDGGKDLRQGENGLVGSRNKAEGGVGLHWNR